MARLCAHGRSLGCARSDKRHGRLRATNISLWRTGSGTAVIVPERPFVPGGGCPGLTSLGAAKIVVRAVSSALHALGQQWHALRQEHPGHRNLSLLAVLSTRELKATLPSWRQRRRALEFRPRLCRSAGSLLHCFIFEPRNDATTGHRFVVTRWRMTQSGANSSLVQKLGRLIAEIGH